MNKLAFKFPDSQYWIATLILAVSCVGIFGHDLWPSDEPRVAEIGREFLDDGASLAVPRLGGEPFLEKPPLYFWCVALSYKAFGGHSAGAARLPSLFFSIGTLLFTYLLAGRMYGRNSALWSCVILVLSLEFFSIAHKSLVDSSLVFFVTGTIYWLHSALTAENDKKGVFYTLSYIFGTGAFYSKGFLGLAFPAMLFICWIVLTRDWSEIKRARLWSGILIVCAGIGIWFFALWKEGSWEYIITFLGHNNLQRVLPGATYTGGHEHPSYYYLVRYWRAFAPWSILTPAVIYHVYRKGSRDKNSLFLVLWFASGFLMLSLAGTKRPLYLVPLFPALSILTGAWFNDVETRVTQGRLVSISQWSVMCISFISIATAAIAAFKYDLHKSVAFIVLMPVILISFIALFHSFITHKCIKLSGLSIVMMPIYLSFVLVSYPYLNENRSLKPFCNELGQIAAIKEQPLYAFQPGEIERAMVPFYTGYYITPIQSLVEMKSMAGSKDVLVLVLDERNSRPLYNSLKDIFPDVLVSGQSGKRHMVLMTNKGK
ncbi:MAG: glycosyltransferase family 39 protein [Candidatus Scalindua sp.]|nr:glycosyltransferase family 39 protein [Candidatus Scalindua sp.]